MATDSADARTALAQLGQRRKDHEEGGEELAGEIQAALMRAMSEGVSKSEAARLLGVHRTTLYRVYNI